MPVEAGSGLGSQAEKLIYLLCDQEEVLKALRYLFCPEPVWAPGFSTVYASKTCFFFFFGYLSENDLIKNLRLDYLNMIWGC